MIFIGNTCNFDKRLHLKKGLQRGLETTGYCFSSDTKLHSCKCFTLMDIGTVSNKPSLGDIGWACPTSNLATGKVVPGRGMNESCAKVW